MIDATMIMNGKRYVSDINYNPNTPPRLLNIAQQIFDTLSEQLPPDPNIRLIVDVSDNMGSCISVIVTYLPYTVTHHNCKKWVQFFIAAKGIYYNAGAPFCIERLNGAGTPKFRKRTTCKTDRMIQYIVEQAVS